VARFWWTSRCKVVARMAFTWGVLDRLLEEPWLRIDGISGTSAGAMNAAVQWRARRAGEFLAAGVLAKPTAA
jgi:predicted acylesterase/phospholipase RssA